ncbi:hypothetical protein [Streptodolium elevatio]|uniref:Uncharacterized protein n=1 Tax=Streptodolium elevatio TaxID=3157996 RepID=A0ABV3DV30_9ACTN
MSSTMNAVRSAAGRLGTAAGAVALAASLTSTPAAFATAATTAGLATAGLAISVRPWRPEVGPEVAVLYLTAPALLAAGAVTVAVVPGTTLDQALATLGGAAVWLGATWYWRPSQLAVRYLREMADGRALGTVEDARTPEERLTRWWAEAVGCDGGAAPGTRLENARVDAADTFGAVIVAPAGQPVPDIPPARLSALTDIPVDRIRIEEIRDRGSRYKRLIVGTPAAADMSDLDTYWAARVAPTAMPGSQIVDIRRGALVHDHAGPREPAGASPGTDRPFAHGDALTAPTDEALAAVTAVLTKQPTNPDGTDRAGTDRPDDTEGTEQP